MLLTVPNKAADLSKTDMKKNLGRRGAVAPIITALSSAHRCFRRARMRKKHYKNPFAKALNQNYLLGASTIKPGGTIEKPPKATLALIAQASQNH